MRARPIALGLVGLAVAVAAAFAVLTGLCGARQVSEPCVSTEDCDAKSVCVRALHPMALPFLAGALVALPVAWRGLSLPLMALGVALAGVGTIFGFSMGLYGIGIGAILALAGGVLSRDRVVAGAAVAAALLPVLLVVLILAGAGGRAAFLGVYAAAFAPLVLWLALAGVRARRV